MNTLDELKEYLTELGHDDSVVFESPDYADAVIGVSTDGNVIYDYNMMTEHLVDKEGMSDEEAMEFIDYNTIRSLPYIREGVPPIIIYTVEE